MMDLNFIGNIGMRFIIAGLFSFLLLNAGLLFAAEIKVAVASNFANTINVLVDEFERETGHTVSIIIGSSGKHYAQIIHGAPFHVFFSADAKRAILLDQQGIAIAGSRFVYAIGKLVLWSPINGYVDSQAKVLEQQPFSHLAVANPKLAPYGKAAQEVLLQRNLWQTLRRKMVRGENIGQTYQFVKSGNAELGLVALSQVKKPYGDIEGSYWLVPQTLYSPIEQQAVLLKDDAVAREFLHFVRSKKALQIIKDFGYVMPD